MISIPEKIRRIDDDYEELMFTLSDNSNERIFDVKRFTVYEVHQFMKQLIKKAERLKNARKSTDTD